MIIPHDDREYIYCKNERDFKGISEKRVMFIKKILKKKKKEFKRCEDEEDFIPQHRQSYDISYFHAIHLPTANYIPFFVRVVL